MRQTNLFLCTGMIVVAACGSEPRQSESTVQPADMVLTGGVIHTMDADNRVADAIALRDGIIVYVGDSSGAAAYVGEGTRTHALDGRPVLPGFTDSHAHLPSGGAGLLGLSLVEAESGEEAVAMVRAYADAHPELEYISGAGWELNLFEDANPSKALLDAVVPDRPVLLVAADGHNSWANSKAFELAGVTAATQDPPNGRIERNEAGEPSGTLREAAQGLVGAIFPEPPVSQVIEETEAGIRYQLSHGITATIDAAVLAGTMDAAYLELSRNETLPHRIRLSLLAADEMVKSKITVDNVDASIDELVERRVQFREAGQGRLDAEAVKIFVDGVPENYTAAMIEPYVGTPFGDLHKGTINLTEAALDKYILALENAGFQVHVHALGDRAVRISLNAFEKALTIRGDEDRRHHISHLEFVQPDDIARFAPLAVTANLQALWHYEDEYISELTRPFIREELHRWFYPAKSFLDTQTRIVWGSDWPVSTSDAFDSIEVAVTRKGPHGEDAPALVPEEALGVDDMIRALTINGAYLMGQEKVRGSLEVGKLADFFIASADPYTVPVEELSEITVLETFVEGVSVYKR